MVMITLYAKQKKRHRCTDVQNTDVQNRRLDSVAEGEGGCSERTALKQVYYQG